MKLALIGLGKMGRITQEMATSRDVDIISTIDPHVPQATHKAIDQSSLAGCDVCVCFTQPDVAVDNVRDICAQGKHIVMATTGWEEQMQQVQQMVAEAGVGMVYSSNFSLGVNLFFQIIAQSAALFDAFAEYDVSGYEMHHNRKRDAPSGTAKTIIDLLLAGIQRKSTLCLDRPAERIAAGALHFASLRCGAIPGTHSVVYDSDFDQIELKHTARNGKGFALGALLAARWIMDKQGVFTEQDLMQALLEKGISLN